MARLLVLFCVGLFAVASGSRCCLPGQILTKDEVCKDLAKGEETPISLTCSSRMRADRKKDEYFVNFNGQLQFPVPNRIVAYEPETFCEGTISFDGKKDRQVALICNEESERVLSEDVYGYCMAVSTVFLIATASWYGIAGLYRDLFGKSVINLCVSLALGLFVLMVMRLVSYTDMNWCAVKGFSAYYFVLVSFFWMNAISIQILFGMKHGAANDKSAENKRFALYMLYAWGVPAVFTVITAVINFMPGDHLKPGIGLNHCWFFDITLQWEYMYSIMFVLTVANVIIFGTVTALLCCDTLVHTDPFKQKFANCIRLFIVMGIPWVFEMVGSITPHHIVWEFIDLFNALQGIWIFVVLVLLRTEEKTQDDIQFKINIISAEVPYLKLEK